MATKDETATSTDVVVAHPRAEAIMAALDVRFAESPDQLFGDNGPQGLRDHLGKPFYVKRVRYLKSSYRGGSPFYAVIDAEDKQTKQEVLYSSGAVSVLIQLARAEKMGWLDRPVTAVQKDEPTANGYYPYRLAFS